MVPMFPPLRVFPPDSGPLQAASVHLSNGTRATWVSLFRAATGVANSLGKRVKKLGSKSQFSSSLNISQVVLLKSKHGYPMLLDFWLNMIKYTMKH